MEADEFRRRSHTSPAELARPCPSVVASVERKRKRSCGDLKVSIHIAYNDSVDGKLDERDKVQLAQSFKLPEKEVVRKFRNCRNFIEQKARKELIEKAVTSEDSPAIDQIAGDLKTNSRRIKECLTKYYNMIISAVQCNKGNGSPSGESSSLESTSSESVDPSDPPTFDFTAN